LVHLGDLKPMRPLDKRHSYLIPVWARGSTFRVKDKEGIKDPQSSLKMLIFPNNCQFGPKFWIRPDEADAFVVNTLPNCSPGRE